MRACITLTTDFGLADGYVAAMKGVILGINPSATIVDISHEVSPQNIKQGSFLLASAASYFPKGTIHVVVVDPGVGTERRPLAVKAGGFFFVAPDNGVLSEAAYGAGGQLTAVRLDRPEYWLRQVSSTFHGRDVFAPAAAHLSLGVPLEALGTPIQGWVRLDSAKHEKDAQSNLIAHVMHIDRFGNVVIDLDRRSIAGMNPTTVTVRISGRTVQGLYTTYGQVGAGELVLLVNSSGFLEVAQRNGSAAVTLGTKIGDPVLLVA